VTLGVVCDGREIIEKDPAMPDHIQEEIIIPLLAKSRAFLVASSVLVPEHQLTVGRAVKEEGSLHAITSDRIIQELRLKSIALRDDSLRSRIELYRYNSINLHLIVTETHLLLSLPRTDGTPDLQNIIINKHPEAVEWCRMLYFYFQSRGELVDLATF
jgi:predicted transcriptional regulator